MHRRTPVLLAGLVVALAACADGPNPVAPASAAGSRGPLVHASTAPTVSMFCEQGGICEATASGGSGSFSFAWTNATESWDGAKRSTARQNCYPGATTVWVTVVATDDATGAQASDSSVAWC